MTELRKTYEEYEADAQAAMRGLHEAVESLPPGSHSAVAAPRCAVCGGPTDDGEGCEFCPAVVHVADCTCGQQGICTRCVLASLEAR